MNGSWKTVTAGWLLGLSLFSACGKATTSPTLGGETHWLQECGPGAARPAGGCGLGLVCSCGMCMAPCSNDASCRSLSEDAVCADTSTTEYAGDCAGGELPRACVSSLSAPAATMGELANRPAPASSEPMGPAIPSLPERWACLDDPQPIGSNGPGATFSYTGWVLDYRTLALIDEVSLRACLINDALCEMPVAEGAPTPPRFAGDLVGLTATLPSGFEGFLRITAPGYVTQEYHFGGPIVQDIVAAEPILLFTESLLGDFAVGLGVDDPERTLNLGMLQVQVLDCNADPAPDVQLRLPDVDQRAELRSALAWSSVDRIPVANRPTGSEGLTGFFNVAPGSLVVEAVVQGRAFGTRSFPIAPNVLTTGTVRVNYDIGY